MIVDDRRRVFTERPHDFDEQVAAEMESIRVRGFVSFTDDIGRMQRVNASFNADGGDDAVSAFAPLVRCDECGRRKARKRDGFCAGCGAKAGEVASYESYQVMGKSNG
jgi:rRNA maturation endonuclease Nob1